MEKIKQICLGLQWLKKLEQEIRYEVLVQLGSKNLPHPLFNARLVAENDSIDKENKAALIEVIVIP